MKQFRYKEWLFVEVNDSINETYKVFNGELVTFWNGFLQSNEPLPQGQYSIIGKADELTEGEYHDRLGLIAGLLLLKSKSMKPSTTLVLKLNEAHTGDKVNN